MKEGGRMVGRSDGGAEAVNLAAAAKRRCEEESKRHFVLFHFTIRFRRCHFHPVRRPAAAAVLKAVTRAPSAWAGAAAKRNLM